MRGFLIRLAASAAGLWVAAAIVPGIHLEGPFTLLFSALFLGVVNAVVRPVAILLTLPLTVLTLGFFLLVINAAMLGLVASLFSNFAIDSFFAALLGTIIVSLVSWATNATIGPDARYQLMVIQERRELR